MIRILGVVAGLVLAASVTAGTANPGAVALNLVTSARQEGMGAVSAGGRDVLAGWSNPALLGNLDRRYEAALVGGPALAGGVFGGFGFGWRINEVWALGVLSSRFSLSFKDVNDFGDTLASTSDHAVTAGGLTAAYRWKWLSVGLTLKGVSETLAEQNDTGSGADIGVAAHAGPLSGGIAVRNLGPNLVQPEAAPLGSAPGPEISEALPLELRFSGAYWHEPWHAKAGLEVMVQTQRAMAVGLGIEWWPAKSFAVRLGGRGGADDAGASFGLTGLVNGLGLDYAAIVQASVGAQHRVALSWSFGPAMTEQTAAAAEEAPREDAKQAEAPLPAPAPGAKKLNFAIADLRAENVSAGDAAVMADLLRSELVKTNAFNVIEKQNMDKVLAEHAFQQTGCSSEECAVKLGKLLNVQRMAVGSFGKLLDSYFLNVRVVDIETGQVALADSAEGRTVSELKVGVRDMARRLARGIR